MRLVVNYAAVVLLTLALLSISSQMNAQDQAVPSPEQPTTTNAPEAPGAPAEGAAGEGSSLPEGAQQAASSMTEEQQSAAKTAFCSALAGQYKKAASAGVSALTDPQVLLTAATNYSSVMHVSVSSATSLLKGFATQHTSEILTSCAVNNATQGVSSVLPGGVSSGVPGVGGIPQIPNTH
jgi:hypothetical protein